MAASKEEGFPADVEEREGYFMEQVAKGELLSQDGMIMSYYSRVNFDHVQSKKHMEANNVVSI